MKNVDYYLGLNYRTSIYRDEEGEYMAEVPDLPGCGADGTTAEEALLNLNSAMRSWIESRMASGLEIPEPRKTDEFSGKLLVRMPKSLHQKLAIRANDEGVSLNQYIVALLSEKASPQWPSEYEAAKGSLGRIVVSPEVSILGVPHRISVGGGYALNPTCNSYVSSCNVFTGQYTNHGNSWWDADKLCGVHETNPVAAFENNEVNPFPKKETRVA